jgi:hypothetical protein
MKMVVVYDTENVEDLQNSVAIMRKLVSDYDQRYGYGGDKRRFARIQFIKILRQWERAAKDEPRSAGHRDVATLRSVKEFADEIWRNHVER